jgi:hypothetical protein
MNSAEQLCIKSGHVHDEFVGCLVSKVLKAEIMLDATLEA